MVFCDAMTKAQRLVELQHLFWRQPGRPISSEEIAQRLGVSPRTVRKYLSDLSSRGRLPIVRARRAWTLAEGARLEVLPVRFLLEEATAVYLAARLLVGSADEPNPAVAAAVAKLASVVPVEIRGFLDHLARRTRSAESCRFADVFRTVAHGWALGRVVEIEYEGRSRPGEPFECRFETHLLEPTGVGSAIYAIGKADPPGGLRVFKLERIRAARLTPDTFRLPPPERLLERLDAAWGIWISEEQPQEVVLRFGREVASRVRETRWHPTQVLTPNADGGIQLTLRVTSTVELIPWVLGWGRHCEVIAPERFRNEVAADLAAATVRYSSGRGQGIRHG